MKKKRIREHVWKLIGERNQAWLECRDLRKQLRGAKVEADAFRLMLRVINKARDSERQAHKAHIGALGDFSDLYAEFKQIANRVARLEEAGTQSEEGGGIEWLGGVTKEQVGGPSVALTEGETMDFVVSGMMCRSCKHGGGGEDRPCKTCETTVTPAFSRCDVRFSRWEKKQ